MNTKAILLSGACALAGCAPLQQAPMVYTSSFDVGLKVGTDSAKPEIKIGVYKVDAAYVPVAVAKPCDATPSHLVECTDKIYGLQLVDGSNAANDTAAPSSLSVTQFAQDYTGASKALDTAQAEFDVAQKKIADDQASKAAGSPPAQEDLAAALQQDHGVLAADATVADKWDEIAKSHQADLTKKSAALDEKKKALENILSGLQAVVGGQSAKGTNDKRDGFSVYGTFTADTHAGVQSKAVDASSQPTAGVTIGQTFSTGIAAQNLTEGLRDSVVQSAVPQAISACLDSAQNALKVLPDGDQKTALATSLFGACSKHMQAAAK